MYSREIDTFLVVAETGSFNQASRQLFRSVPSVVQQINLLEKRLDVQLLVRDKRGVRLTAEGEIFYQRSKHMTEFCRETKLLMRDVKNEFVCGVGARYSPTVFQKYWPELKKQYPNVSIRFQYFSDSQYWKGELPDFCESVHISESMQIKWNSDSIKKFDYRSFSPMDYVLAFPPDILPPFFSHISLSELNGRNLMIIRQGIVDELDELRHEIEASCPGVIIHDISFYDDSTIETCRMMKTPVVIPEIWTVSMLPGFQVVHCDWKTDSDYGFLTRKGCSPLLKKILAELGEMAVKDGFPA